MHTRTLTLALALLGALLVGFAWWVYFQAEGQLHGSIPTLLTVVPVLVVLTILVVQRLAARHAAVGLERALQAEAVQQQRKASPARSAEVERLRGDFERAVSALKGSKLAKTRGGAGNALYELPWYTIIGPPASGKTTALRNSGIKFPHLAGTGDRLKGVGGTRNCDWFLTNHAILLDTAGRWTLEEEDHDEWLAFLDLLKTHRRGHPLNGVIAAISVAGDPETSIAGVDLEGVKELARRMRERLDEITGRLGLALPVYMVFTKCDLISGFVESFGEMSPDERRQVWGFTTPLLSGPIGAPGAYFAERIDELGKTLEQHAISRMADEVEPESLARIYEFPAQFMALKDKLVAFVDELFEDSAYGETPILRGGYFTSGTQEGAPADLLLEGMAQSLNVRPVQQDTPSEEKKSYFLYDMLVKVVFEDRHLATVSQVELLRQQKLRTRWTTGLFAAAALLPVISALSCQSNLSELDETRALIDRLNEEAPPDENATAPVRLAHLTALDEEVARYQAGASSWMPGFGFYQGDDLEPHLTRYFGAALKEWLIRPLLNKSNERLITITQQFEGLRMQGQGGIDERARAELSEAFKLHLLLTTPRDACTPKPLAQKDWIVARLLALWSESQKPKDKAELAERQNLLVRYLELLSENDELAIGRDKRRVQVAREALGGEDKAGQLLAGVLQRFESESRDLTQLAGASTALVASQTVHGAFTREAWSATWRDVGSAQPFARGDESWVLGCEQAEGDDKQATVYSAAFEREYLKRYEETWRRFVDGLSARAPANAIEAESMLGELVGRPGVLGMLFQRVAENTDLPTPHSQSASAADKALAGGLDKLKDAASEKLGKSGIQAGSLGGGGSDLAAEGVEKLKRAFASFTSFGVAQSGGEPALERYRKLVEPVYMALKAYRTDETKVAELGVAAQSAIDNLELLLSSQGGEFNGRLRELLVPPLAGVLDVVNSGCGAQLQRMWCDVVYRPFQDELGGRYPFQLSSPTSASVASFQRFFQPGSGVISNFASQNLSRFVTQEGDRYRLAATTGPGGRCALRDEIVAFLNRTTEVQKAFFPGGSATVRVPFRVRVRGAAGYSVTTLRIGAKTVRYDSGAEVWAPVEWPGEQASQGASLAITPYQGSGPKPLTLGGEWGIFMMLDERFGHAQILERSETQFTAGWKPKGGQNWIKVDFAADDRRSPLMSVPFGHEARDVLPIAVPARITQAGGGC